MVKNSFLVALRPHVKASLVIFIVLRFYWVSYQWCIHNTHTWKSQFIMFLYYIFLNKNIVLSFIYSLRFSVLCRVSIYGVYFVTDCTRRILSIKWPKLLISYRLNIIKRINIWINKNAYATCFLFISRIIT